QKRQTQYFEARAMATVTLDVPDEELGALGNDPDQAARALRLAAAFHLFSRGVISTGAAARLAGLSYAEFLTAAVRNQVDLHNYEPEEIDAELSRPLPTGVDVESIKQS